jgi:hypothetical protein
MKLILAHAANMCPSAARLLRNPFSHEHNVGVPVSGCESKKLPRLPV